MRWSVWVSYVVAIDGSVVEAAAASGGLFWGGSCAKSVEGGGGVWWRVWGGLRTLGGAGDGLVAGRAGCEMVSCLGSRESTVFAWGLCGGE